MSLEEMYNKAGMDTYVGRVRSLQAADVGAGRGVNFLDGQGIGKWTPGRTDAPDQFQKGFTRESEGTYRYGAVKVPGATNDGSFPLSGWLEKSLKLAFDGQGPPSRPRGYWLDSRFTIIRDPRNANTKVHLYAPLPDRTFSDSLNPLANSRINGRSSGPSPAGLNG